MTNAEKFKTFLKRRKAYDHYRKDSFMKGIPFEEEFIWLEMEYKDHKEELKPCPFCEQRICSHNL